VEADDDALAVLSYTSGTTGRPRGVMLSHGNLLANHGQIARSRLQIQERDVVLCVLPLFHIYALNVVMGFSLSKGATLLLIERFDPTGTLEEVERHRGSVLAGAPPMYVAWNGLANLADFDLASVRYAVSGAAPLPGPVLEEFTERTGVALWEGYGLTETSPVVTTTAMGTHPKPGSVGRPLPGVEVRLVDDDAAPVRRGDPGEVCVRGPNVFTGYWNDPEGTAEVLDDEGWFATGDIGYADDEGDLYLVDRKRDLIIVSGFNVYPREVEEALARHPGIAQAAAVGIAHPQTGEAVKAFCVPAGDERPSAEEVIEFARGRLARFKVPVDVEFVDELPLLSSGKVRRVDLRDDGHG
jgi:long-chain acyl-CoA synthetase